MKLAEFQRTFLELITQPLTASDGMRARAAGGKRTATLANALVKPSGRVTPFERLELYNTGYWFRILAWLADDFPGLRAVIGPKAFDKLSVAYLDDCPPPADMRDLGARLESWLRAHPGHAAKQAKPAIDMVRLEWADIEASDSVELPRLAADDLGRLGGNPRFRLQPGLRLLDLDYPVDVLLLNLRGLSTRHADITSNALAARRSRGSGGRISPPKPEKVLLAVHRQNGVVYFKRLEPEAFRLLRGLAAGWRLSAVIENTVSASNAEVPGISERIKQWFAEWSLLGWFAKQARHRMPSDI